LGLKLGPPGIGFWGPGKVPNLWGGLKTKGLTPKEDWIRRALGKEERRRVYQIRTLYFYNMEKRGLGFGEGF